MSPHAPAPHPLSDPASTVPNVETILKPFIGIVSPESPKSSTPQPSEPHPVSDRASTFPTDTVV